MDMAFANELIRTVREQSQMTLEGVSLYADFALSTIHKYEQGQSEVPARYVRSLYQITGDLRLARYMFPAMSFDAPRRSKAAEKKAPVPPPGDPRKSNEELLNAIQDLADVAKCNNLIFQDGAVTAADTAAILKQQTCGERVIEILQRHFRNMDAARDAAEKARK